MFRIGEEEKEDEEGEVVFSTRLGVKKMTLPYVASFEDGVGLAH